MLKKIVLVLLSFLTVGQMALALPALAVDAVPSALDNLNSTQLGGTTGGNAADAGKRLPALIGSIIKVLISLLGVIFLVLMVYAGFKWMTARGETEPIDEAKSTIRSAIIGLILILLAYAITGFVIDNILKATT